MPRPDTTMKVAALRHFGSSVAGYYAPLFGTPAAEVAREIGYVFLQAAGCVLIREKNVRIECTYYRRH